MFARTTISACVLLLSLFAFAPKSDAEPIIILTPKESISFYAKQYGASEQQLLSIATCESRLNPDAIHIDDGGKGKHSVGIFQYQKQTFYAFSKLMGEDLDYYSYNDQIRLTAWIFAKYPKLKSHWTCSKITHIV